MQSILKKRVETNIKCYVCDGALNEEKCLLLDSVTPYSKTSIPNKIGQLLGDQYVILVSPEDSICKSCYDLFKLLDELETRTQNVKNDIINHLTVKYHVISDDTQSDACAVKIETLPSASKSLKRKIDSSGELLNHEEIEQQLSQMFGSPIKITSVDRSKKRIQNYKCIYCKYQSNIIAEYKKHIGKCKRTNILKCSECNVIFNEHVLYRRHMKEVHYSRYKCLKCDLSFNSEAVLKNHLSQNICDVLVCKICQFQARTKEQYMEHIKTHSRPMFKCGVCYQRFESKAVLNNHVKTHRSTSFWCGICRKSFNQRDTLMLHLKSHTNTRGTDIKRSSNSMSQIENSLEIDNDKTNNVKNESKQIEFFTCNNCQLTFLNELTYLQHMKTHNMKNEKPFKEEKIESNNSIDLESIIEKLHSDYEEVQKNDTSVDETQISEKPLENDTEMQHDSYSNSNESQQIENKVLLENISNAKDILENGNILVYKCSTCEKIYENSNDLQIHLLTDHNNIDSEIEIYQIQRNINDANGLSVNDPDKSSNIEMSNSEGTVDGNSYILSNHDNMNGDNFENIAYINSNDNENVKYVTINAANGDESHILTSDDKEIQVLAYDPKMTDDLGQSIFVDSEGGKIQFVIIDSEMQNMITSNENADDVNCNNKIPEQSQDFSNNQNSDNSVINEFLQNAITTNDIALEQSEYLFHDGSKVKIIDNKKIEPSQQIIENSKNSTENHDFNLEDICDIKTESNNQIRDKNELDTNTENNEPEINNEKKNNEKQVNKRKLFICGKCGFKSINYDEINSHVNTHNESGLVNKSHSPKSNQKNVQTKPKKTVSKSIKNSSTNFTCNACGRLFKTKTGLMYHEAVHTGKYNFFCKFCNKGFMSKAQMLEHQNVHSEEERVVCDICGKKFKFQSTYWIHRKWHNNPYPYSCEYCGRKFQHSSLLAVHKRKHTGERPYQCIHCKVTFTVSGTLKRHLMLHTGAYPFKCNECSRSFTTRHKYADHLAKVHKDDSLLKSISLNKVKDYKMVIKNADTDDKSSVKKVYDFASLTNEIKYEMVVKSKESDEDTFILNNANMQEVIVDGCNYIEDENNMIILNDNSETNGNCKNEVKLENQNAGIFLSDETSKCYEVQVSNSNNQHLWTAINNIVHDENINNGTVYQKNLIVPSENVVEIVLGDTNINLDNNSHLLNNW